MEQEVVLDVKVKNQSLKQQLREAVLEAQALQERFGATSKEAVNAAKRVANIKEEISDMNQVFKVFNPEEKFNAVIGVAQGIAGGFQAVTGAMQLFGTESKEVEKALLKVQAASAFAEGINNIAGLGDAFKNLGTLLKSTEIGTKAAALAQRAYNAVMAANPIGLLIAGLTALVGVIALVVNAMGDEEENQQKVIKSREREIELLNANNEAYKRNAEFRKNLAAAQGKTAEDLLKMDKQFADERKKQIDSELDLIKKNIQDRINLMKNADDDEFKELQEKNNKDYEQRKKLYNERYNLDASYIINKAKLDTDAAKKEEEKRKEAADKAQKDFEERKKRNMELAKQDEEALLQIEASRLKAEDDRNARLKTQKDNDEKAAIEAMKKQVELNEAYAKADAENAQRRIDNQIKIRDASIEMAQQTLNGLISLAEIGIKNEKKLEQAKKIAALVQIGIDTARAISGIVAAASMDPKNALTGGLDIPLKIAAGIVTVLANMAKAKQILSASGSSGSAPSLSTAAIPTSTSATNAGGGVPMEQGPAQQGQTIANANLINNAMNNQNMIRAVVVETDITDSQRRVRGIEDRATFG